MAALLAVGTVLLALIILHGTYDLLETTGTTAHDHTHTNFFDSHHDTHHTHDTTRHTGKQKALLSDQLLKKLNNGTRIMEHYPHTAKAANTTTTGRFVPEQDISISKHKVVYVIVDGLRYDCTSRAALRLSCVRCGLATEVARQTFGRTRSYGRW